MIATRAFWSDLRHNIWRGFCRRLLRLLEFSLKDWLRRQAYDSSDTFYVGDRHDRLF
jgi:hypothetical protein